MSVFDQSVPEKAMCKWWPGLRAGALSGHCVDRGRVVASVVLQIEQEQESQRGKRSVMDKGSRRRPAYRRRHKFACVGAWMGVR